MAKILLVDDAAFMRMMLTNILTKLGHEIVGEASNGGEAIVKYESLKPDITFMDITMPDVDGIEGVKGIIKLNPDAKIIMCSAMGQKEMILDSIKAGAKDFVVKPFDNKRIQESVTKNG